MSKQVVLRGDATQDTRDRYGRLLAYVWLPGGKDLGHQLIAGGFRVYVYRCVPSGCPLTGTRGGSEERGGRAVEGLRCTRSRACRPQGPGAVIELPSVLFAVPADRRRPRLPRHPRRVSRPSGFSARIRTGWTATTTDWAASRARVEQACRPKPSSRRSRRALSATRRRTWSLQSRQDCVGVLADVVVRPEIEGERHRSAIARGTAA